MKLPAFLTADPKLLVRKLVRSMMILGAIMGVLIYLKYERDQHEKQIQEMEERKRLQAEAEKIKEEVSWEQQVKLILPDQEELLTPNVVPQLLLPPLLGKIQVPDALVYERKQRYTAAYDFKKTPAVSFWAVPATAAGLDVSAPLSIDLPAISPPLSSEPATSRKPKPPKGVGKSYILLP